MFIVKTPLTKSHWVNGSHIIVHNLANQKADRMMNSYEAAIISIYGELVEEGSKSLDFTMVGRTPSYICDWI